MKIYVVTSGQDEDYGICTVFSTEELARESIAANAWGNDKKTKKLITHV